MKRGWDVIAGHYFTVAFSEADYRCTYVSVNPFLAADFWLFLLTENWLRPLSSLTSACLLPWVYWWILWIQTLTKPDDHSLLVSWIPCSVSPPTAAPKPASTWLTNRHTSGKPVLGSSCVLGPLYWRWLWTSAPVCFCKAQGMLKLNFGMLIFTVYSLFWAPVLMQLLCLRIHTLCNT